ncbi:phosphoribosyltransferase family protein [Rurimicrobium arvi]|uniref:Bifunctional pyr operon transcriptional regulator/uracil phosphoribosyltransferase PyrR n=1 Tax=Rurimicrobium arvi TaxID=2049916 RepID=A0ABP8MTX1_9BACT
MQTGTLILSPEQIDLKIQRMAFELWEKNTDVKELYMIGIAGSGQILASLLAERLRAISKLKVNLEILKINKERPLENMPELPWKLDGKSVVLVDDVSNSGKVLLYTLKPVLDHFPKKIVIAVLVDRRHKSYPINPDIVGYSLSTTLQENILVQSDGEKLTGVFLN